MTQAEFDVWISEALLKLNQRNILEELQTLGEIMKTYTEVRALAFEHSEV